MNPLIEEAQRLQEKSGWSPQGLMPVKKIITSGDWKGHTAILWLQFYSPKELNQATAWAQSNGYVPMGHDIFTGSDPQQARYVSGDVPNCPIHGTPMKPSKKVGEWYCSRRVGGGYCDAKI